jgi:hypothetical protein
MPILPGLALPESAAAPTPRSPGSGRRAFALQHNVSSARAEDPPLFPSKARMTLEPAYAPASRVAAAPTGRTASSAAPSAGAGSAASELGASSVRLFPHLHNAETARIGVNVDVGGGGGGASARSGGIGFVAGRTHSDLVSTEASFLHPYGHLSRHATSDVAGHERVTVDVLRGGVGYAHKGDKAYAEPAHAPGFHGAARPAHWRRDPDAVPAAKLTWLVPPPAPAAGRPLWQR